MANPGSILGQIGESFEQIGKDVAHETVQAPKDVVGTALESLGISSGNKNPKQQQATAKRDESSGQEGAASQPNQGQSEELKRVIARAALEELSGKKPKQKEPTVWEKIQQEEEQKKQLEKKRKEEAAKQALPKAASKRPRGDLYGVKAKKTSTENRNVRQD